MKKFHSYLTVLALGSVLFLGSCSKNDDEDPTPSTTTPDASITVNENTNKTDSKTIVVPRSQNNVTLQVTSVTTTSSDQKRLYIYQLQDDETGTDGDYQNISGFKTETSGGTTYYYYEIPADQKNNVTYTHTFPLRSTASAEQDTYVYTITKGTITDPDNILMGPVTFNVKYGKLTKTEGLRVYNILGTKQGAFDLKTLTAKSTTDGADLKDLQDEDDQTAVFEKKWQAQNDTRFAAISALSDADLATLSDKDLEDKYNAVLLPSATTAELSEGDFLVVKLRGQNQFALIKVTDINDDGVTGAGHNDDYIEFTVWK